jgi:hypothetical protein
MGKTANINLLGPDDIEALLSGDVEYFTNQKVEAAQSGKTYKDSRRNTLKEQTTDEEKAHNKDITKVKQVITTLVENIDVLLYGTNTSTVVEAFAFLHSHPEYQEGIVDNFGIDFRIIEKLFERKVLNCDLVQLLLG